MARQKLQPAPDVELAPLPAEEILANQNLAAGVHAAFSDDRDLLNQLLGQAQMAGAFEDFSRTVRTSKLAYVKESKLYRALAGKPTPNGSELSGTWDEFCSLLGMSVDKADMDISNLRAFGEEALESMSRMGIGYRELRQYRRLPEDAKTALIEVAKSGDKEALVDLAEELILKHAKEKAALTKKAEEAEATLEAARTRSAEKSQELDQVREEKIRLERHLASLPPVDLGNEIREALAKEVTRVELEILTLRATLTTLMDHGEEHGVRHDEYAAGLLCQLRRTLGQLHGEFDIKIAPDGEEVPAWLRADVNSEMVG